MSILGDKREFYMRVKLIIRMATWEKLTSLETYGDLVMGISVC